MLQGAGVLVICLGDTTINVGGGGWFAWEMGVGCSVGLGLKNTTIIMVLCRQSKSNRTCNNFDFLMQSERKTRKSNVQMGIHNPQSPTAMLFGYLPINLEK